MGQHLTNLKSSRFKKSQSSAYNDELERDIFSIWYRSFYRNYNIKSFTWDPMKRKIKHISIKRGNIKIKNRYGRKLPCITFNNTPNLDSAPNVKSKDDNANTKDSALDSASLNFSKPISINSDNTLDYISLNKSNLDSLAPVEDSEWVSISDNDLDSPNSNILSLTQSIASVVNTHLVNSFSLVSKELFEALPSYVSRQQINTKRKFSDIPPPLVYIGSGHYTPSRIIKPLSSLSVDNLRLWYLMTKSPGIVYKILQGQDANNYLLSKLYYPYGFTGTHITIEELGCDFSIQFVHPSIRTYLFTANDPSYYYLFQESISKSDMSHLASALLEPDNYLKRTKIDEDELFNLRSDHLDNERYNDYIPSSRSSGTNEGYNHPKNMTLPHSDSFIGISMCPGGFFLPYHLGVLSLFCEHNIVNITTPLAGSSAGSMATVSAGMGLNFYQMMNITENIIENFRARGIKHRLNKALYQILNQIIPSDSHDFLNNRIGPITCCCTLFTPIPKPLYTSKFYDKQDLVHCIIASSNIPMYSAKFPTVKFRGGNCIDGLFSSRKNLGSPPTGSKRDIVISPFHALQVGIITGINDCVSPHLAALDSLIERYLKLKSLQNSLLSIKFKLRSKSDEWKRFIEETQTLYKRLIDEKDIKKDFRELTYDLVILTKHLTNGQIKLFRQVVRDSLYLNKIKSSSAVLMGFRKKISGNSLTSDDIKYYVTKFTLLEWINIEVNKCTYGKVDFVASALEGDYSFNKLFTSSSTDFRTQNSMFDRAKGHYERESRYDDDLYYASDENTQSESENIESNKMLLDNNVVNVDSILTIASDLKLKIKRIGIFIDCILKFLYYIFPPNQLTYFYTNACTLISPKLSPTQIYNFALKGSSLEDIRQMFDQGRADSFRWIILEYILLENHLYNKLQLLKTKLRILSYCLYNLNRQNECSYTNEDLLFTKSDTQSKIVNPYTKGLKESDKKHIKMPFKGFNYSHHRMDSNVIRQKQMNYINNILGPPDEFIKIDISTDECKSNKVTNVTTSEEPRRYNHNEEVQKYLFKKRNDIVKKAIKYNILKDSDFIHILSHTANWIIPTNLDKIS